MTVSIKSLTHIYGTVPVEEKFRAIYEPYFFVDFFTEWEQLAFELCNNFIDLIKSHSSQQMYIESSGCPHQLTVIVIGSQLYVNLIDRKG